MILLTESFIIFYLSWSFVMSVLCKDNYLPNKLDALSGKIGQNNIIGGFILGVSECVFCTNWWSSLIGSIGIVYYYQDYKYLAYAVFCPAIASHFRQ